MSYISKFLQTEDMKLFAGYVLFAGFATLVDLALLYSLTESFHFWYLYSAGLAYFVGMVINYLLNKYFNFKNKSRQIFMQFGLFGIVALVGLGINQLVLYSLVEFAKFWYMSAKVVAILIGLIWSFYGHKKLTIPYFQVRSTEKGIIILGNTCISWS